MEEQQSQPAKTSGDSSLFQLNLDAANSYSLRTSASWAKVLGVVGISLGIIIIVIAIKALSDANSTAYSSRNEGLSDLFATDRSAAGLGAAMLIIAGVIFIVGAMFSYAFGNRISAALKTNDQNGLERGFAALRNYFALRGIVLIIVLLLFLISLAGSF